jgi:hypothetical protein
LLHSNICNDLSLSNIYATTEQDHIRWQVAKTISKLYKLNRKPTGYCNHNEKKIVKNLKEKLYDNKAIITRADKGNTIVIIYHNDDNQKTNDFFTSGQFNMITKDPTNSFQKSLRMCLNKSKFIISESQKARLININPTAPNIRGLIKLHKPNHPIRPVVNWKNAPLYKTTKFFTDILSQYVTLPNALKMRHNLLQI